MQLNEINFEKELSYDPETGYFFWKKKHKNISVGDRAGSINSTGHRIIKIYRQRVYEHRLAWFMTYGEWPEIIDHINRERDDNRLCNLRNVSRSGNAINQKLNERSTTGIRGVYLNKVTGKYRVRMRQNGKAISFGQYNTLIEAKEAAERILQEHTINNLGVSHGS